MHPRTASFRIVTFNVFYALQRKKLEHTLPRAIERFKPDAVALQEVWDAKRPSFARSLAARLGYHLSFAARTRLLGRAIGVALLTRERTEEHASIGLPHPRRLVPRPRRILQMAGVEARGVVWTVGNTHLEYTSAPRRREEQLRKVIATFDEWHRHHPRRPQVLVGDFNSNDRQMRTFGELLRDAKFVLPKSHPVTWRMLGMKGRLDWVAVRGARISAAGVLEGVHGSDHRPLWAEVRMTRQ